MLELEGDIKELELEPLLIVVRTNKQKKSILNAKYNKLSSDKAVAGLIRLKQTHYDQEEKAGKLLAWCIKTQQNEPTMALVNYFWTLIGLNFSIITGLHQ